MKTTYTRILLALALFIALGGCGARERNSGSGTEGQASSPGIAPSGHDVQDHVASSLPKQIHELTDQVIIYECPKCERMFDTPGQCTFDQADLYATKMTYFCDFDGEIATQAGRCPKCGRVLKIEKAKMLPGGIRVERVN